MYAFGISHADPDEMMRNHDLVLEGRRQLRRRQHQLDRLRRHELPAQALRPGAARPSQRLGRADAPSRRSAWISRSISNSGGCSASTSSRSTASASNTGSRTTASSSPSRRSPRRCSIASDCALPVAGSGQWGGQAPETYRADRPHHRSALSLRRRHRQPSRRAGRRRARRAAGLAGGGRGHPARRPMPRIIRSSPPRSQNSATARARDGDATIFSSAIMATTSPAPPMSWRRLASNGVATVLFLRHAGRGPACAFQPLPRHRPCRHQPQRDAGMDG